MTIYDLFAGLSVTIGVVSGSFLLRRAWHNRPHLMAVNMLILTAAAIYWISAIYFLSLIGVDVLQAKTLVVGAWIRPVMPILLASPSILVRISNL